MKYRSAPALSEEVTSNFHPEKNIKRKTTAFIDKLKASQKDFKTLSDNAPDVICRFDKKLRQIYVNPAIEKATGIPIDDHIGKTLYELGMPNEFA